MFYPFSQSCYLCPENVDERIKVIIICSDKHQNIVQLCPQDKNMLCLKSSKDKKITRRLG